jgi:hypothetical protein
MELTATNSTRTFQLTRETKFQPEVPDHLKKSSIVNRKSSIDPNHLPQGWKQVKTGGEWQIYRTRFLIKAKQLSEPLVFVDALGREHCGQKGDYLVESSDGTRRIAPRAIFEDVYVAIAPAERKWPWRKGRELPLSELEAKASPRPLSQA